MLDNTTENAIPVNFKDKADGKHYTVGLDLETDDNTSVRLEYIFKKPSTVSYDRYVKKCGTSPTTASKDFALDNIIEEQREKLKADLEEYPASVLSITDKLFAMLGLAKSVDVKKL